MATVLLEKPGAEEQTAQRVVGEAAKEETGPVDYHWTVEALYRALDAGVFEYPERLELIQGRIIEKMPQDPIHRAVRVRLGRQFRAAFAGRLVVMEECPVRLAYDTELIADVVVTYGEESDFDARHPIGKDVAVLVEVANTTMASDLGEKAIQYAQSKVNDFWVVLVKENTIVVHRQPSPAGYQDVTQLAGTDALSPLALPDATWTVNALLGRNDA